MPPEEPIEPVEPDAEPDAEPESERKPAKRGAPKEDLDPVQELLRANRAEIARLKRSNQRLKKRASAPEPKKPIAQPSPKRDTSSIFDVLLGRKGT